MRTEQDKGDVEVKIFLEFLERSELPIDPASVQKRPPGEPDILCTHTQEGYVAFELAELCSPEIAKAISEANEKPIQVFSVADPSLRIVRKKLKKDYETQFPRELLIYSNGRLITPDDVVIPTIKPFIESSTTEFRRVWLLGDDVHLVWEVS
jgi:hypothetical protein